MARYWLQLLAIWDKLPTTHVLLWRQLGFSSCEFRLLHSDYLPRFNETLISWRYSQAAAAVSRGAWPLFEDHLLSTLQHLSVSYTSLQGTLSSDISFASSKRNVAWDQQYSNVVWGKQISETLLTLQELNHLYISSSDCRCHDIKNELYSSAGKYNRDSDGRK